MGWLLGRKGKDGTRFLLRLYERMNVSHAYLKVYLYSVGGRNIKGVVFFRGS
jgi:hypothetical protein